MQNQVRREESSLGLLIGISTVLLMGYTAGSPGVAPMLPASMERPFTKLHEQLHSFGSQAVQSVWGVVEQVISLFFG